MSATPTIDSIHLRRGAHRSREEGLSVTEAIAYVAGEEHSDRPACLSPVLGVFLSTWSDALDDETRQRLLPYVPRAIGTANDGRDERRGWLALDWLVRVHAPAWLELVSVAELVEHAGALRALPELRDEASLEWARGEIAAAAGYAAAAAGRDYNLEDILGAEPRVAAGRAAKAAARLALRADAAGVVAWTAETAFMAASTEATIRGHWVASGEADRGVAGPRGYAPTTRTAAWRAAGIAAGLAAGIVAGLAAGIAAGLVAGLVAGIAAGLGAGLVALIVAVLVTGFGSGRAAGAVARTPLRTAARAAGMAALAAAGVTVWVAARVAGFDAGNAVWAASGAAGVIASAAAAAVAGEAVSKAATTAELEPTARKLQESAFELLDRLIDPATL